MRTVTAAVLWISVLVRPAFAGTEFAATLSGQFAVPPTPSPATGSALFVLNDEQTEIEYSISFSGLLGDELAAHVHNAPPGEIGPTVFNLGPGNPKGGLWSFVTPFIVGELLAGRLYVNIHTTAYTDGEIRGNLTPSRVSADESTWGRIKALFL